MLMQAISSTKQDPININFIIDQLKQSHHGEHKCSHCTRIFKKKSKLQRHINQSHLLLKPFKCQVCNKEFKRSHHLERHKISHTNDRPFQCQKCTSAFNSKDHLSRHIKIMHLRQFLKCQECGQQFLKKRSFRKHEKQHQKKKQKVEKAGKKIKKQKMMYICTFEGCHTPFSQHYAMRRHYNKMHKIEENGLVNEKSNPTMEQNKEMLTINDDEGNEQIFLE